VEEGEHPVVFSTSPDSPAAPFLVEHKISSLREMNELGFIPPFVELDHLYEIRELAKRVSFPGRVKLANGQWVSDHAINGLNTLPRRAAVSQEVLSLTAAHLEGAGINSKVASAVANRVHEFVSPLGRNELRINMVNLLNLDVRGFLYVDRKIFGLSAMDVTFHWAGWIVPEGSHFYLTCNEVKGVNDGPDLSARVDRILQDISGVVPKPGPIEGWTDRLPVDEIRTRAMQVTRNWR
jgi:hypothetical protein